jgi:Mrp family chromosome partitioning ATPase
LFFIPGGSLVTNPTELLANGRLKRLLDRVGTAFDWIILDSPPVVPVSDASILADVCDGVLLVLRAAATPVDMAQKAQLEFKNKPILGVVLNRVEPTASYGNYYYHGYKQGPGKKAGKN